MHSCHMDHPTLSSADTTARLAGSAFVHLDGVLYGSYRTSDFSAAAGLVARVAEVADVMNHHPEIRLGYGTVDFDLSSHDAGGVTDRDLALADEIQRLAGLAGATDAGVEPSRWELAIDTTDAEAIRGFWMAGLDYVLQTDRNGAGELVDPRGRGPKLWFQAMEPPRTQRNRIHLDVYVPAADAETRVAAALAAGGTLVTDEFAPDWWVLADVEGNELCVCTSPR
ncbi:MAG: VOC family protein [Microbacteriaceae bacterium]